MTKGDKIDFQCFESSLRRPTIELHTHETEDKGLEIIIICVALKVEMCMKRQRMAIPSRWDKAGGSHRNNNIQSRIMVGPCDHVVSLTCPNLEFGRWG